MDEKIYSRLLRELLADAKSVGSASSAPITAERFLVAAIDKINGVAEPDMDDELKMLRNVLYQSLSDVELAKTRLLEYVNSSTMSFLDDLYMKKRLSEAVEKKDSSASCVSADFLAKCIITDPSDAVKAILASSDTVKVSPDTQKTEEKKSDARSEFDLFASALREAEEKKKEEKGTDGQDVAESEKIEDIAKQHKEEIEELVQSVKRIREDLTSVIYGQDNAINVFVSGYFQSELLSMIDKNRKRPKATFLFAGPPGVGKTFLAEEVAKSLKLPFMRFDMSEYSDKEASIEFCGSDSVYKNGKSGNVTSFIENNPKCVLLFDEIEKAHISIIHLFLQMLDAGRIRDNNTDTELSLKDTIIIMTTNAGHKLYEESESQDLSLIPRKVIIKSLETDVNPATGMPFFPGAICSRFASGNVVMFNHMTAHNLRTIAKKEILRNAQNLENETGIKLIIDEKVYTALLFSEGSAADARTVRSRAEAFFNDELYELFRMISSDRVKSGISDIEDVCVELALDEADTDMRATFENIAKTNILVFSDKSTVKECSRKFGDVGIVGVCELDAAIDAIKSSDIDIVLLDMSYGVDKKKAYGLNIEDAESPVRDFFKFLGEHNENAPVLLIESDDYIFSEEERISFARQGVRGIINISKDRASLEAELRNIASTLYQQACMEKLAKENKLITFSTSQSVSSNGKHAKITLFDFETEIAVESEDAKNVLSSLSKPNVRFEQIIGAESAKKELNFFIDYLKNPKKFMGTGLKAPRGVLLYGPPGTGKTMLAKAMACESGVTFIAAEGNQFLKKYIGEGPEKVHELFRTARKYAPAILFIDEIDAIGKERRGSESDSGGGVEATLTAFLTEMDGFSSDPTRPVFVLAATNFDVKPGTAKSLDGALMRRFDRQVYIDLPNKDERIKFLKFKRSRNAALAISDSLIDAIALRGTGMSLADLDSIAELALRSAIREGSTTVTDAIFEEAFETFNCGEEKKWDAICLERVARHEAGHALLCYLSGETPTYLTIVARGNHGGYMQHANEEGKSIYTKDELLGKIRTSLGGRAAEIVCYGERDGISTGASGDLSSATRLARYLVSVYGMDEEFGLAVSDDAHMSAELRRAVNRILDAQMKESVRIISENRKKLDRLVKALMNKNHMTGKEIEATIEGKNV